MIDREKLKKFLIKHDREAHMNSISVHADSSEYYYELGRAHALHEIIRKFNKGDFDNEE
jgi:hypothetical protein